MVVLCVLSLVLSRQLLLETKSTWDYGPLHTIRSL